MEGLAGHVHRHHIKPSLGRVWERESPMPPTRPTSSSQKIFKKNYKYWKLRISPHWNTGIGTQKPSCPRPSSSFLSLSLSPLTKSTISASSFDRLNSSLQSLSRTHTIFLSRSFALSLSGNCVNATVVRPLT